MIPVRIAALAAASLLAFAGPAAAEYIVFQDGRAMKVATYRFEGGETVVELASGGSMRFSSEVVRYVAPDEDVEEQPPIRVTALDGAPALSGWEDFADPRWVEPIRRAARAHDLDPALVAAVVKVESDFRPHAVSPKGAMGLMQLMPSTARELGVGDAFEPESNLNGGAAYLRKLLHRYDGDRRLALAAYNAGPRAVDRARGVPAYAETRSYVERVEAWLGRLGPAAALD